jgi:hypothetical protein
VKRPSFQFYPADWRKDANLRRCSPSARGVWMDVLCVLHDSDDYGIVRWPLKELASAAGAALSSLRELGEKRVLKGCDKGPCEPLIYTPRHGRKLGDPVTLIAVQDGPIWYSSRFVRDEYVRTIRGESSRFGDGKGDAPMPTFGDGPTSSPSSSPSGSSEAKASAGDAGKRITDPDTIIFGYGVPLLTAAGSEDKHARSFLGGLRKHHGDAALIDKLRECIKAKPLQPLEWLAAALPPDKAIVDRKPAWHESRSGIVAKGVELGIGAWDEYAASVGRGEQFHDYSARVLRAAGITLEAA